MKTAYHATETRNSEQILRGGLEADLPLADQSLPCGVYLFSVLTDAEDYAALNFDEWTILAVNIDGIDLTPDPTYDEGVAWIATGDIDAGRIDSIADQHPVRF